MLGGFLTGLSPLIAANVLLHGVTARRVVTRLLNTTANEMTQKGSFGWLGGRMIHQLGAGLLLQPRLLLDSLSRSEQSLTARTVIGAGTLLTALIALGLLVYLLAHASRAPRMARWLSGSLIVVNFLGNVVLGPNGRARYLGPAYDAAALLAGVVVPVAGASAQWAAVAVTGLNLWHNSVELRAAGPPLPYASLIQFLRTRGLKYGYSGWSAIPLTFLSNRELLVAGNAGDPERVHDKTLHVTNLVDTMDNVFYVFLSDDPVEARFALKLETFAKATGVTFQRDEIPPFRIYWNLSRPIRPEEFGRLPSP